MQITTLKSLFSHLLTVVIFLSSILGVVDLSGQHSIENYSIDESIQASETLIKALELNPNDQTVYHVFTHGKPGQLLLDGNWSDAKAIEEFLLDKIPPKTKEVYLYGCNFARGDLGRNAIAYLEQSLKLTISASSNTTGKNGDWILEHNNVDLTALFFGYSYSLDKSISTCSTIEYTCQYNVERATSTCMFASSSCESIGLSVNNIQAKGTSNNFNVCTDPKLYGDDCDFDGDGVNNIDDLDDDNDGILDVVEGCAFISEATLENNGTFGTIETGTRDLANTPTGSYTYSGGLGGNNRYLVTSNNGIAPVHPGAHWEHVSGHTTGEPDDAFLAVNGATTSGVFYRQTVTLDSLTDYNFGLWAINGAPPSNAASYPFELGVRILNASNSVVDSVTTGSITSTSWVEAKGIFNSGNATSFTIEMYNISKSASGNDFAVDDIYLRKTIAEFVCLDTDNDGIPNNFDLDSDGDGCYDSYEAGVIGATKDGSVTDSLAIVTTDTTGVGANGFTNTLETNEDGIYTGTYTYSQAVDGIKYCEDTDNDGIPNELDLDDDNDGVLDLDEGVVALNLIPNFAPTTVGNVKTWSNIATYNGVSLDLQVAYISDRGLTSNQYTMSNNTSVNISGAHPKAGDYVIYEFRALDNATGNRVTIPKFEFTQGDIDGYTTQNKSRKEWEVIGFQTAEYDTRISSNLNNSGFLNGKSTPAGYGLLRDASNNPSNITNTSHDVRVTYTDKSSFRVLFGVTTFSGSGTSNYAIGRNYFFRNFSALFYADTDGDGILDKDDLDSDGDGCYDSYEAGVIGATNDGSATDSLAIVTTDTSGVGANGFANTLETNEDGVYIGTYQNDIAINSSKNECEDWDGDSVPDYADLDNDNDGILDSLECPFNPVQFFGVKKNPQPLFGTTIVNDPTTHTKFVDGTDIGKTVTIGSASFVGPVTPAPSSGISISDSGGSDGAIGFFDEKGYTAGTGIESDFTFSSPTGFSIRTKIGDSGINQTDSIVLTPINPSTDFAWMIQSQSLVDITILSDNKIIITGSSASGIDQSTPWSDFSLSVVGESNGFNMEFHNLTTVVAANPNAYDPSEVNFAYFMVSLCGDSDSDGIPNYLDLDSDNDNCPDFVEAAGNFETTDGVASQGSVSAGTGSTVTTNLGINVSSLGVPVIATAAGQANTSDVITDGPDKDFDGIADACDDSDDRPDNDGDGIVDVEDLDDDNDGILDTEECGTPVDFSGLNMAVGDPTEAFSTLIGGASMGSSISVGTFINTGFTPDSDLEIRASANGERLIVEDKSGYDDTEVRFSIIPNGRLTFIGDSFSSITSNYDIDIAIIPYSPSPDFAWNIQNIANANVKVNNSGGVSIRGLNNLPAEFLVYHEGTVDSMVIRYYNYTYSPDHIEIGIAVCPDVDGDGIPNVFDLDSDGDGCFDSYEADVTGATNDGSATDSLAIVTTDTTGVGANGFANFLETDDTPEAVANYTVTYANAIDGISSCNQPPLAINDIATTQTDNPATGNVLTNDEDPDGDPLVVNTTPINVMGGSVTIDSLGNYTFTPTPGFEGEGSFEYEVCDDGAPVACDTAVVVVQVIDVTDPDNNEVAGVEDNFVTENDAPLTGDLLANDSDPDGDDLTINTTPVTAPTTGTLVINADGTFSFTPATDFVGEESFTYEVCDDGTPITCDTATVTIEVLPGDGENSLYATDDANTGVGGATQTGNVTDNDNDPESDNVTVTVLDDVSNGTLTLGTDGTYSYVPNAGFIGNDAFTYQICDDGSPMACDSATAYFTVLSVNQPPLAINDIITTQTDNPATGNVLTNDEDPDGDPLVVNTTPINVMGGSVTIDSLGNYTFTPTPGFEGEGSFEYEVCDDGAPVACDTAVVVVQVIDVTDPDNNEVAGVEDNFVTENDAPLTGDLLANDSDPDGDNLTINTTPVTAPTTGTLVINADGTFSFTPATDFVGTESFTYEVCDDGTPITCDTATVTIEVLPGDGENSLYATDDANTGVGGATQTGNVTDNDNDPESDNVTVTVLDDVSNGTLTLGTDGIYSYVPNAGFTGNDAFVYQICDDGSPMACDSATAYFTVLSVNQPPLAINDIITTQTDNPATGNVLTNDEDPDGDPLVVSTTPINVMGGSVTIDSLGNYTFTPTPGFEGEGSFEYEVCDDGTPVACDTAVVVVQIIDVTDPDNNEVVGVEDNFVTENDAPLTGDLLANDSDPDGDDLMINTTPVTAPTTGTLVINTDGTFSFTPATGFVGEESFTYEVCDDGTPMTCDTVTVTIEVLPGDGENSLFATDDANTGVSGATQAGNVADNDNDPESDNVTVTVLDDVSNGTLTLGTDGIYSYVPNAGFTGNDAFVYQICDDGSPMACDSATAYFTVLSVNQPPIVYPNPITLPMDSTAQVCMTINDLNTEDTFTAALCTGSPANGTATPTVNDSELCLEYTPNAGVSGIDEVCVIICDQAGLCDTVDIPVTILEPIGPGITPVAPIVIPTPITVPENDSVSICTVILDENQNDTHTAVLCTSSPTHGTATANVVDGDLCLQYKPNKDYSGSDDICVIVCDQTGLCDTIEIPVQVVPMIEPIDSTQPPVIIFPPIVVQEDSTITVCGTVVDPNTGDMHTITGCGDPTGGTATTSLVDGEICVTYDSDSGFSGSDSMCVIVCDQTGLCDTLIIPIEVLPSDNCSGIGSITYAITDGKKNTTAYVWDTLNLADVPSTQMFGTNRSTQSCQSGTWTHFYNSNEPDKALFSIEMGANTTPIEYVEIRAHQSISDLYDTSSTAAIFPMARDWHVQTVGGAALTAPVNIRFYYVPAELKAMLDAAQDLSTIDPAVPAPTPADIVWFKKDVYDPVVDCVADPAGLSKGKGFTTLMPKVTPDSTGTSQIDNSTIGGGINYMQFDGITGFSGGGGYILLNGSNFPIELTNFDATATDKCETHLNWTTSSEENTSHFEILATTDGDEFYQIGRVKASGTSIQLRSYNFVYQEDHKMTYYRIKAVDFDGTYSLSKIIAVESKCQASLEDFVLYPNPAENEVNIMLKSSVSTLGSIVIIDSGGRILQQKEWVFDLGTNKIELNTSEIPAGFYNVRINIPGSNSLNRKFIKLND